MALTDNGLAWDAPQSAGVANILRRAERACGFVWSPVRKLEQNTTHYYTASNEPAGGQVITGLPYSSARNCNRFIGLDVSVGSFIRAAANPFSDLYGRDLSDFYEAGYSCCIKNAFLFYGTVCSAFVNYSLNEPLHRSTHEWGISPEFERLPEQSVQNLRLADTLVTTREDGSTGGHVRLVTGVGRDTEGRVCGVEISEGVQPVTVCRRYTAEEVTGTLLGHGGTYLIFRFRDAGAVQDLPEPLPPECPDVWMNIGADTLVEAGRQVSCYIRKAADTLIAEGTAYSCRIPCEGLPETGFAGETFRVWQSGALPAGEYTVYTLRGNEKTEATRFTAARLPKVKPLSADGQPLPVREYRLCAPDGSVLTESCAALYDETGALREDAVLAVTDGERVIAVKTGVRKTENGILVRCAAHFMDASGEPVRFVRIGEPVPLYAHHALEGSGIVLSFPGSEFCTPSHLSWKDEGDVTYLQRMLTPEEASAGMAKTELVRHNSGITHCMVYCDAPFGRISAALVPVVFD